MDRCISRTPVITGVIPMRHRPAGRRQVGNQAREICCHLGWSMTDSGLSWALPSSIRRVRLRQQGASPVATAAWAGWVMLALGLLPLVGSAAETGNPSEGTKPLPCSLSWVGNTFGSPDKWVQMEVQGMVTAPDGTCYTNVFWEEGGGNVTLYKDGRILGTAQHTHGWGYEGGAAVAVNNSYLFIAQRGGNEGGGLKAPDTWPAKGKSWFGVSRRRLDARTGAPFAGGLGGHGDTLKGCFLLVNETEDPADGTIWGMWADARRLYVSTPAANQIQVYDADTMAKLATWALQRPRQLTEARDGSLWVVSGGDDDGKGASIVHLSSDGKVLPGRIPGVGAPRALAMDGRGRLLVADNGVDQQIKIFGDLALAPRLVGTLGRKGGILGRVRGVFGPQKFNGLVGVGSDQQGNIYVCSSGTGTVLEAYKPDGTRLWSLQGLEFVDCGDFDPASGRDVYTKNAHFILDYGRPPGQEWRYQGCTLDRIAYPEDPRCGHAEFASTWVRRLQGRLVVFGTDMYADHLLVYRSSPHDEILIPSGMVVKGHFKGAWPPNQPARGEWIWRDANGNGAFDAGEFQSSPHDAPDMGWGWWVDTAGDIWQAGHGGVRRIPFQGFDAIGNPTWSLAKAEIRPMPAPFTGLERIIRDPVADTMLLSGWTSAYPNDHGNWKTPGKVIVRYDHWNSHPAVRWEIHPPFDVAAEQSRTIGTTVSMTTAGEYLFVAYLKNAEVRVYRLSNGRYVGSLIPTRNLSGWIDIPYGINARKRADGEYLILAEEDSKAKNILYRWKPDSGSR